jgi:hypothetical protein
MKKKISVVLALIFSLNLLITNYVFASERAKLDVEKVAIKAIENANVLVAQEEKYKNAANSYYSAKLRSQNSALARWLRTTQLNNIINVAPLYAEYRMIMMANTKTITESSIRLSAYEAYINLIKTKNAIGLSEKSAQASEQDYNIAKMKLESGMISILDAEIVEKNYLKSQIELRKLKRNEGSILFNLNKLMGEPISNTYEYIDNNMNPAGEINTIEVYINQALANRAEVISNEIYLKALKENYKYSAPDHPISSELYNEQSRFDINEQENKLETTKLDIRIEINKAYAELKKRRQNMDSTQKAYEIAKKNYKDAENLYSVGQISKDALVDFELNLMNAETQFKNTQLDVWFYQQRLEVACGVGPGITK